MGEQHSGLPAVAKTTVRVPPRANGWISAHCPPSSEWGPGGNTGGGVKAARKGTGHPTSQSRWPETSVLSNRHSPKYGSITGHIPPPPLSLSNKNLAFSPSNIACSRNWNIKVHLVSLTNLKKDLINKTLYSPYKYLLIT